MMLVCVALSAAGCATVGASDGAGYAAMYPNAVARGCIWENDKAFTLELAAHNIQCGKDPLCRK